MYMNTLPPPGMPTANNNATIPLDPFPGGIVPRFTRDFTVLLPALNTAADFNAPPGGDPADAPRERFLAAVRASALALVESVSVLAAAPRAGGGGLEVVTRVAVRCAECEGGSREENMANFKNHLDELMVGFITMFNLSAQSPFEGLTYIDTFNESDAAVAAQELAGRSGGARASSAARMQPSVAPPPQGSSDEELCRAMDDVGYICSAAQCGKFKGKQVLGTCCEAPLKGRCRTIDSPPNGCGGAGKLGTKVPSTIRTGLVLGGMLYEQVDETMARWTPCCYT
jgi:hypothetical protein